MLLCSVDSHVSSVDVTTALNQDWGLWIWLIVCRYDYNDEDYDGQHKSFRSNEVAFCQPYSGTACSGYIGNEIVYVTDRFSPSQVEKSLRGKIGLLLRWLLGCQMLDPNISPGHIPPDIFPPGQFPPFYMV